MNAPRAGKLPLLYLCHRIPYPPNKGDKIRSYHLLRHLSRHFDVYLATFIDDPFDRAYIPDVEQMCADSLFVDQGKFSSRLRSLSGLISGEALSVPFYASRELAVWVNDMIARHQISRAMVFSSSMAQYVLAQPPGTMCRVVDFVDVDSDKWAQYAEQQPWPQSWLYRRESRKLLDYEMRLAREFDAGLFVSHSEAELFRQLSPATASKIGHYNNGVNTDYFSPDPAYPNPFSSSSPTIVFTGAMDYWPNIDAVAWFSQEVLPELRKRFDDIAFCIVGSNPAEAVCRLGSLPGVEVTGRVEDVRPYLQHAVAVVAPMRIARGVQNKVLEAMAMGKPVLVSSKGLEGITAGHGDQVLIADELDDYLAQLQQILAGEHAAMGERARAYVSSSFNWDENLPAVVAMLSQDHNRCGSMLVAQDV